MAGFGDDGLALGGPGCPLLRESAVTELAAALGSSTAAGSALRGRCVGAALPVAAAVAAGPRWRVPGVAGAAGRAGHAGRCARTARTSSTPTSRRSRTASRSPSWTGWSTRRWSGSTRRPRRRSVARPRRAATSTSASSDAGVEGVVEVHAGLDLADAIDLESALVDGARELARLGCGESLGVRRSLALGELARGQATLEHRSAGRRRRREAPEGPPVRRRGRQVVLHAHLSRAAVTGRCDCGCECRPDPDEVGLARLDARGSHGARGPLTAAQVREPGAPPRPRSRSARSWTWPRRSTAIPTRPRPGCASRPRNAT